MMKFFSLYSGGKDSSATTQWLSERGMLAGVVAFDTGISTPDWRIFVERTANERGWDLEIYKTPAEYDKLVVKYGFPGPAKHGMFMNYLKGRCVRAFKKKHKGAMLASGVRSGESRRRFMNTHEWSEFEGVNVFAPLYNWSTEEVWRYVIEYGYERSPAYQALCISGDCLCGAYATKLERAAINAFYPDLAERISRLEKLVDQKWGWGAFRDRKVARGQLPLFCADCESRSGEVPD